MKKLLLLTILFSGGAWANCDDPKTSYEVQKCLSDDLKDLNKEMQSSYSKLYKQTQAKVELKKSQNAWDSYKDIQCGDFIAVNTDHSPASTAYSLACQADLIQQRIEFINNQID